MPTKGSLPSGKKQRLTAFMTSLKLPSISSHLVSIAMLEFAAWLFDFTTALPF